jgi:hypothetical protein
VEVSTDSESDSPPPARPQRIRRPPMWHRDYVCQGITYNHNPEVPCSGCRQCMRPKLK